MVPKNYALGQLVIKYTIPYKLKSIRKAEKAILCLFVGSNFLIRERNIQMKLHLAKCRCGNLNWSLPCFKPSYDELF